MTRDPGRVDAARVYGDRTPAPSARDLAAVCRAISLVLPGDAAFSHQTAAELLGLPLPRRLQCGGFATPENGAVHVVTSGVNIVRRHTVIGHRGLENRCIAEGFGVRCTDTVDTFLDLATVLSLDELIVLGDAILARAPEAQGHIIERLAATPRARGRRRAREALLSMRAGSRSPMETLTRLQAIRGGATEPELNADIYSFDGAWLANVDLCWRASKVIVEYDGDHHSDTIQRGRDAQRRRQLTAAGWTVIVVTSRDILRPHPEWTHDLMTALTAAA